MIADLIFWTLMSISAVLASPLFTDLFKVLYYLRLETKKFNEVIKQLEADEQVSYELIDEALALSKKRRDIAMQYNQ
jgi:hypothetical protein